MQRLHELLTRTLTPPRIALLLLAVAAATFSLRGINSELIRDDSVYLYAGQQFVAGVPPYVSIFDAKGPMSPFLIGWSIMLGNTADLYSVHSARVGFLMLSCGCVAALFLLAQYLFRSRAIGLLAALLFLSVIGFGEYAIAGPRAKTPMVLFEILALYFMSKRSWFWAAFCGALAALVWQPSAIFLIATFLLALLQGGQNSRDRIVAAAHSVAGGALPYLFTAGYYISKGELQAGIDGYVLFSFLYLDRPDTGWIEGIVKPLKSIHKGDAIASWAMAAGFFSVLALYGSRVRQHAWSALRTLREDRFAGLLVTYPIPFIWSIRDFQDFPDAFIFLPYLVVALAWALWHGINRVTRGDVRASMLILLIVAPLLVAYSAWSYAELRNDALVLQRWKAARLRQHFPEERSILAFGAPQFNAILEEVNLTRYGIIFSGMDRYIHDREPGGFAAWLQRIEEQEPPVVVWGWTRGYHTAKIRVWLNENYVLDRSLGITVYERRGDAVKRLSERAGDDGTSP